MSVDNEKKHRGNKLPEKTNSKENAKTGKENENNNLRGVAVARKGVVSVFFVIGAIVAGLIIATLAFGFGFTIQNIEISGNSSCSEEEIIALSGLKKGSSVLFFRSSSVASRIQSDNPYVRSVKVKRVYPNTITIGIEEYTSEIAFEISGVYWLADGSGVLLELTRECPENICVINGVSMKKASVGVKYQCGEQAKEYILKRLLPFLDKTDLIHDFTEINMEKSYQPVAVYQNRIDFIFGSASDVEKQVAKIPEILQLAEKEGIREGTFDLTGTDIIYNPSRTMENE